MQAGGSKYVEKGKVAKFVTQLAAQFIEDKMRISILSIICVCGEPKNVAEYYCDVLDCPIMLIECTFFTGDNFSRNNFGSGNFGGNFNAGDNYRNFGGAGSSFGGNQTNIGGFGGQANQSSGFNSPQPQQQQQQQQQQQSNFSNQMGVGGGGGSFGNQSNSVMQEHSIPAHRQWWEFWKSRQFSNAGALNTGPSPGGGNYSAQSSSGQTNGLSGSEFGGQRSSGLSTGMTTGNYKDAITVCTHVKPVITVFCIII